MTNNDKLSQAMGQTLLDLHEKLEERIWWMKYWQRVVVYFLLGVLVGYLIFG